MPRKEHLWTFSFQDLAKLCGSTQKSPFPGNHEWEVSYRILAEICDNNDAGSIRNHVVGDDPKLVMNDLTSVFQFVCAYAYDDYRHEFMKAVAHDSPFDKAKEGKMILSLLDEGIVSAVACVLASGKSKFRHPLYYALCRGGKYQRGYGREAPTSKKFPGTKHTIQRTQGT